jgi:hypothetical protein
MDIGNQFLIWSVWWLYDRKFPCSFLFIQSCILFFFQVQLFILCCNRDTGRNTGLILLPRPHWQLLWLVSLQRQHNYVWRCSHLTSIYLFFFLQCSITQGKKITYRWIMAYKLLQDGLKLKQTSGRWSWKITTTKLQWSQF